MTVPGSNLLNRAFRKIAKQKTVYYKNTGRTVTDAGYDVTSFAAGIDLLGSLQPVPRSLYLQNGLDFQKSYALFYVSKNIVDVGRDTGGDELEYAGRRYKCESDTPWFNQDGWLAMLMSDIGPAKPPINPTLFFGFGPYYKNFDNGVFFAGQ